MLPDVLFGKYRQYKDDTTKIATWLAETAAKCGYASPEPEKPKKLKGRARKIARDARQNDGAASSASDVKHIIKVKDFVKMAEAIARASDVSKSISTGLIKVFKRCIQARSDTIDWYALHDDEDDDDATEESHSHFVGVLQKTLQVLVPVHELQKLDKQKFKLAKSQGADDGATSTLKVTNAFGQLDIYDIDESNLDAIPDATVERTEPRSPKKYEIDDEGEEWLFAVHCFYNDMHQIKDYLMRLWENYSAGDIDLATAAVTTNTAIDLIRRSEDDMRSSNLRLPEGYDKIGHSELPELWFMECCIRDGLAPPRNDALKYMVPLEAWEQVEESFLLPFRLLSSSAKSAGEPIMITRPAWFGN